MTKRTGITGLANTPLPIPTPGTAQAIWRLLKPRLTRAQQQAFKTQVMQQALVVVLDAEASAAAFNKHLFINAVLDALLYRWSPRFLETVATKSVSSSFQLLPSTGAATWSALRESGIRFHPLLRAATNGCGLYDTKIVYVDGRKRRRVTVNYDSPLWAEFNRI